MKRKNNTSKKIDRNTAAECWVSYPEHKPNLGDEIIVCYGDNNKKELIQWTMKFVGTGIKFKWFSIPKL